LLALLFLRHPSLLVPVSERPFRDAKVLRYLRETPLSALKKLDRRLFELLVIMGSYTHGFLQMRVNGIEGGSFQPKASLLPISRPPCDSLFGVNCVRTSVLSLGACLLRCPIVQT